VAPEAPRSGPRGVFGFGVWPASQPVVQARVGGGECWWNGRWEEFRQRVGEDEWRGELFARREVWG